MKRTVLRVVLISSLVAIAIPAAALPASAKKKPQFPTTPDSYLPATVGGLTVILRGGTCPPDTINSIDARVQGQVGDALALGGVCVVPPTERTVTPTLKVLSPVQLASEQANFVADPTIAKSPVVTKKNVSGINVEIDQYIVTSPSTAGANAGETFTVFSAFGTPVKGKIVTQAMAPDEATALAGLQTMLQAAQGKVPRLVTTPPNATRNTPQDPDDPDAFFKALPGIKYGPPYDEFAREALNLQAGRTATKSATGEEAAVTILTCPTAVQPCAATSTAFTPSTLAGRPVFNYTLNDHAGVAWWPAPMEVLVVGQSSEFVNELMASLIKANTIDKPKADKPKATRKP
jgi:hypothetical protein